MLVITVEGEELFDDEKQEFKETPGFTLTLEHSLASVSKWESKYQKPFLEAGQKTTEELLDYVMFMGVGASIPRVLVDELTNTNLMEINNYIESPQSATTFGSLPKRQAYRGEVITSELVYYWLVAYNIPFECENWHLNRLFSLIRICNIKNTPAKKQPRAEIAQRNRELNEQRKAALGTSG
jgi:hypothetical protein